MGDATRIYDAELERFILSERDRVFPPGWELRIPGEDGIGLVEHSGERLRVIHSLARENDNNVWLHISVSRCDRQLPTWAQLRKVKDAFIGAQRTALQVLPPAERHISIAEILHLWCCLTSDPLPDFTRGGDSI